MIDLKNVRAFALSILLKSADFLRNDYKKTTEIELKAERDYVTSADTEVEKMIINGLSKNFPEHNLDGEESGLKDKGSDYTWIIDPLCSTNNFVFGLPMFGTAVALVLKEEVVFGAISIPFLDKIVWASRGEGAFCADKPVKVSNRSKLSEALILYDNQFHKDPRMLPNFSKLASKVLTMRISGSAAFDMAMVGLGNAEARIFHRTKKCDFAAGALIVEEGGGKVSGFNGEPWNLAMTALVVSNGKVHEEILGCLK